MWADLRTGGWSWENSRQLVGDVDGDGLDDVVSVHSNPFAPGDIGTNVWVHHNTGDGFANPELWAQLQDTERPYLLPFFQTRYALGDTDGDGRADLVSTAPDSTAPGTAGPTACGTPST